MEPRRSPHGFTLIELLIVVAIIAILAAIAVPNFLEAQMRSKISRMTQDMSVISAGLRSYYADFQQYPPHHPEVLRYLQHFAADPAAELKTAKTPDDAQITWRNGDPVPKAKDEETTPTRHFRKETPRRAFDDRAYGWPSATSSWYGAASSSVDFPALTATGTDLLAITTPVAYLSKEMPIDVFFTDRRCPPIYLNLGQVRSAEDRSGGFVLVGMGPSQRLAGEITNPIHAPILLYDPTNGTISPGMILRSIP